MVFSKSPRQLQFRQFRYGWCCFCQLELKSGQLQLQQWVSPLSTLDDKNWKSYIPNLRSEEYNKKNTGELPVLGHKNKDKV